MLLVGSSSFLFGEGEALGVDEEDEEEEEEEEVAEGVGALVDSSVLVISADFEVADADDEGGGATEDVEGTLGEGSKVDMLVTGGGLEDGSGGFVDGSGGACEVGLGSGAAVEGTADCA